MEGFYHSILLAHDPNQHPQVEAQARATVCSLAHDKDDAQYLLTLLGLIEDDMRDWSKYSAANRDSDG